jgi:hypothetical protein
MKRRSVALPVLLLATLEFLLAQNPYGRIEGYVRDKSGAAVPSATVRVTNLQTRVVTETRSSESGYYVAGNLVPGEYAITVEAPGFKRLERTALEVRVGDAVRVDFVLEIGEVVERVTVVAEVPLLETGTANLGQLIDRRRIEELPLPANNPMYLMQLTPGTIATNPPTHPWLPNAVDASSGVTGGGVRSGNNEFQLDGVPNVQQGGQLSIAPSADIVQEMRVQVAAYDASVGHFTGLLVNMVIKTGTNDFHGTLFYSNLSRPLMGRDFFVNRAIYDTRTGPVTREKINTFWPATRVNHYRGTFSGPVYLPRAYDGRNRTFFLYGLDVVDRSRNEQSAFTVPTEAQRRGDFSGLLALGSAYQIYDPATIAPAPGGRYSRQPFPGNIIPANRIHAVSRNILGYYPLPNATGTADGRQNYIDPQPRTSTYYGHFARVDHSLGARHRFFITGTGTYTDILSGVAFHNEARGTLLDRRHAGLALNHVSTLRPNLVLEARAGVTRYKTFSRPVSFGFDIGKLGFDPAFVKQVNPKIAVFPQISIDAYTELGGSNGSRNPITYYYFYSGWSWVRGSHSWRFGGEHRILRECMYNYGNDTPRLEFGTIWTRGPLDNSPPAPVGQGLASFLLGLPTGGWADRNDSYAEQSRYTALYLHDDAKLSSRLTLNIGLRWEFESPTTERYNRMNRGFDFVSAPPFAPLAEANYAARPLPELPPEAFRVRGGLLFAGQGGVPRALYRSDYNNLAPRFGFAWDIGRGFVLRGGYGIFYEPMDVSKNDVPQQGYSQRTSLVPSLDNGLTFRATISNPFPDPISPPPGASAGLSTFVGRGVNFFHPERKPAYMQRWSFGIQKEIRRLLMDLTYLGNRGTGLGRAVDFNPVPAQWLSRSPLRDQKTIDFLSQQVSNPYFGLTEFSGSNMAGRNVSRAQLLRPLSQFIAVSSALSDGFSWYHSLQAHIERRFGRGFTLQANYTWSKLMEAFENLNATDTYPHRVISVQDRPQVFNVTAMYELPFGKGQRWLREGKWSNLLAGGWTVQGLYQGQSGPPLGWGNVLFLGNIKDITLPVSQRSPDRWFNTEAGFVRDPRQQLDYNIRTFPLRFNDIRGDGYNNWNLALFKNIRIGERWRLQMRAEAIDAMNHPMFSTPNTSPTSSAFGTVSSVAGNQQRQVWLGAKLTW